MSNYNIWNNSWGSITNRESTPPSGWSWDFSKNVWQYSGQITSPNPPLTIYQTSSIDCFPDVVVNTTGDPIVIPTGDPVHIPGTSPGRTTPTPPAPPVSNPIAPVPKFGQMYNVCFDDGLLNQKGWTRPRYEGCKLRSLYYNEYTDEMDEGKELSTIKNANLDTSIDGLQFIITSSHEITFNNKNSLGNPFEKETDSGIVTTLYNVSHNSLFWANEFRGDIPNREKYPPKSCGDGLGTGGTNATGVDQTYQKLNKSLAFKPFGPKVYDVPLVPTSFYKLNHYTQDSARIERKPNTFDLIPTPIRLNPIDPTGINGGPFFLGGDSGQNEQVAGNDRLSSEHQIRTTEREYVWNGPWSYTTDDGTLVNSNTFPGGVADPTDDETWGYNETAISRSAIIPQTEAEGDITYGKSPVIENYSNAIFFGNTIYGYQQSDVFPGPGPNFSYVKLEKAYIFNSDDDSFFVQEIKSEGEDRTFQNLMQSTFPWATDFRVKLLDYDQENNLETSYGVHWNRGYFSEIATYSTASANRTASGHYPGTGTKFTGSVNEYIDGGTTNTDPHEVVNSNGVIQNQGAHFRKDHDDINGGGFYYLHSDNGGGEGGFFSGGFKRAGMDFGRGELDFPKHQQEVSPGNWKTGPGVGSFFGLDPLPGGIRYYTFRFHPVHRPLGGMSAGASSAHSSQPGGYNQSNNLSGRVLSGTFEINDKNPSSDWWFSKGGEKEIKWVSESKAADVTSSLKMFMDECHKQEELYILTFNEAKHVDKSFNQGFTREDHPYKKRTITSIPGYPGDPALGYADAYAGEESQDGNVRPYSYYVNYTRPLNTFGSMLYSKKPEAVGVKNAHNLLAGMGDGAEIGMGHYDYSEEALNWSATTGSGINPDTNENWSKNDKDYKGKYTGYGPMGGIYAGGINAPRFLNGVPFVEIGDTDGIDYVSDGEGSSNQKDANGNVINTDVTVTRNSVSVWTAYMYGNNYRYFKTGGDSSIFMDFRERKKWPGLNTWTISKLEQKPNYILTDLNKQEELPQGVGDKGFILIPDTLNPRIKANLDFYLMKAGLIEKERAPKYKDKSIKRNTFLAPSIKLKKRKRRGWFWKLKKRIKGKDY